VTQADSQVLDEARKERVKSRISVRDLSFLPGGLAYAPVAADDLGLAPVGDRWLAGAETARRPVLLDAMTGTVLSLLNGENTLADLAEDLAEVPDVSEDWGDAGRVYVETWLAGCVKVLSREGFLGAELAKDVNQRKPFRAVAPDN